jgi:signal transduction histidine kinase
MLRIPLRFRRLGLQRRIMLYVALGLGVMFGALAFLGLGAIDQATQLVYRERLSTAYTTAGIIGSNLARVAADVQTTSQELDRGTVAGGHSLTAQAFLDQLGRANPYPFFRVSGVWLLNSAGDLIDAAGRPVPDDGGRKLIRNLAASMRDPYVISGAVGSVPGAFSFASIVTRLPDSAATATIAVVQTVSVNSSDDFNPASYGRPTAGSTIVPGGNAAETYHLEVVDPSGHVVLGIGADEVPGGMSRHYPVIQNLMTRGSAAALLHVPGPTDTFAPHVMAVVQLAGTPFYVVLEQPIDVALALPLQLRGQLLLAIALGFVASLAVAWVTTRHVVKPTEELTVAAERMAGGDLASPINVTAQDEVGQLAESLDAMRRRLRAAYEAVESTNKDLEQRVAERTDRLGQLLRTTISTQEDERRRLARELHDETAQTLAALAIALDRARDGLEGATPEVRSQISHAKQLATLLLAETRRMILGLRPTVLDDMGLLPAIRWYCETYLTDAGIEVAIEADQAPQRLPAHIEVALFRIVQEAIANVAKHAQAHHVDVRVGVRDGTITVAVADDGRGFDVDRALGQAGPLESVGLLGMQERVRLLNGRLEIRSREGAGTLVLVEAPLSHEAT